MSIVAEEVTVEVVTEVAVTATEAEGAATAAEAMENATGAPITGKVEVAAAASGATLTVRGAMPRGSWKNRRRCRSSRAPGASQFR